MNNLKIWHGEQQTAEWHELRRGRLTSSCSTAVKANGKGLGTVCRKKAWEIRGYRYNENNYISPAMQLGIDNEANARAIYEWENRIKVHELGFAYRGDLIGDSPDGVIMDENTMIGCIEIKHYLLEKYDSYYDPLKIESGHITQCQWHMWVLGVPYCDYVVYNYQIDKIIVQRIEADESYFEAFTIGAKHARELIRENLTRIDKITKKEKK